MTTTIAASTQAPRIRLTFERHALPPVVLRSEVGDGALSLRFGASSLAVGMPQIVRGMKGDKGDPGPPGSIDGDFPDFTLLFENQLA